MCRPYAEPFFSSSRLHESLSSRLCQAVALQVECVVYQGRLFFPPTVNVACLVLSSPLPLPSPHLRRPLFLTLVLFRLMYPWAYSRRHGTTRLLEIHSLFVCLSLSCWS